MRIKKVTKNNFELFHKTYIKAFYEGFDGDFVPKNFIKKFDENFLEYYSPFQKDVFKFLCFENDEIVGVFVFSKSDVKGRYFGLGMLDSIYFLKKFHGKSYAEKALHFIHKKLKQMNYSQVVLWCSEENLRAKRFYEKNGYKKTKRLWEDNLDGKIFHNYLYIKSL